MGVARVSSLGLFERSRAAPELVKMVLEVVASVEGPRSVTHRRMTYGCSGPTTDPAETLSRVM